MRALQRRNQSLESAQELKRLERLRVRRRDKIDPSDVPKITVLRADARIIKSGRHRMGCPDLAVIILQDEAHGPVQHAQLAGGKARRVAPRLDPQAARLDPDHPNVRLLEEVMEQPDRVAAAADAGDQIVRQSALDRKSTRL